MREILFRGKRIDNDEWVFGSFCMDAIELSKGPCGIDGFIRLYDKAKGKMQMHEVDRETVGQYTGLTDKNGKKIFDGDVIRYFNEDSFPKAVVRFGMSRCSHVGFYLEWEAAEPCLRQDIGFWVNEREIEVIGNIHDNPELLEALNG